MQRNAFVTGAGSGLGLAIAEALLERNWVVFAGAYDGTREGITQLAQRYPDRLYPVALDISDDHSVTAAADYVKLHTGALDLIVNNAAILGDIRRNITEPLDFEEMQQVYNVNVLGSLRVANKLFPLLLQGATKLIVNISSEAGSIAACWRDSWFGYCMSKAALNMQSALLHNELKAHGGQVLVIHPGHVQTFMQGKLDTSGKLTPKESAEHIAVLIANHQAYAGEHPAFLDYSGRAMPW